MLERWDKPYKDWSPAKPVLRVDTVLDCDMAGRKRKSSISDTLPPKKAKNTPAADQVFDIPEIRGNIISFVPRDEIPRVWRVSKAFWDTIKSKWIQGYLHDVPSSKQAGQEVLHFREERISDFLRRTCSGSSLHDASKLTSVSPGNSCILGYGGEHFIKLDDPAYKDQNEMTNQVLRNTRCARPCLLNERLDKCNLNPEPLKRLICALLAAAWAAKANFKQPMQPDTFQITCDADFQSIRWIDFQMGGVCRHPLPKDTFEATVRWVFWCLSNYTESRIMNFDYGKTASSMDCAKAMVLCQAQIRDKLLVARSTRWTLEQTCCIINSIPEEHYVQCRDKCAEMPEVRRKRRKFAREKSKKGLAIVNEKKDADIAPIRRRVKGAQT